MRLACVCRYGDAVTEEKPAASNSAVVHSTSANLQTAMHALLHVEGEAEPHAQGPYTRFVPRIPGETILAGHSKTQIMLKKSPSGSAARLHT